MPCCSSAATGTGIYCSGAGLSREYFAGMRRSKEIMVLLALLLGMMAFVLWYVLDRRGRTRAIPPVSLTPPPPARPVDLTQHDGQTLDLSSGRPVVKDSAEDRAALVKAKQEMDEAMKGVTFGPPARKPAPPPEKPPEPAKP